MKDRFIESMPNRYHPFTVKYIMCTEDRHYVVAQQPMLEYERKLPGMKEHIREALEHHIERARIRHAVDTGQALNDKLLHTLFFDCQRNPQLKLSLKADVLQQIEALEKEREIRWNTPAWRLQ